MLYKPTKPIRKNGPLDWPTIILNNNNARILLRNGTPLPPKSYPTEHWYPILSRTPSQQNTATRFPAEHRYPILSQTPLPDSQPNTATWFPTEHRYRIPNRTTSQLNTATRFTAEHHYTISSRTPSQPNTALSAVSNFCELTALDHRWSVIGYPLIHGYIGFQFLFKRYTTCLLLFKISVTSQR